MQSNRETFSIKLTIIIFKAKLEKSLLRFFLATNNFKKLSDYKSKISVINTCAICGVRQFFFLNLHLDLVQFLGYLNNFGPHYSQYNHQFQLKIILNFKIILSQSDSSILIRYKLVKTLLGLTFNLSYVLKL